MSTDEDDEMTDIDPKSGKFIDWSKFKRLFLFNKRVWKYMILYAVIYFSFRKYCAPWFDNKKVAASLGTIDRDEMIIENLVGHDSHKVATNMAILADCIAHLYLVSGSKYRNATTQQLVNSITNKYKNDETDNHILDVHVSVWVFLLFLDMLYCIKKKNFSKDDALWCCHHSCGLITSAILKYKEKGGLFWCWVGFWSEGIAVLMLLGSITRTFYQKQRPDLVWIRNFSDVTFAMSIIGFVYARIYLFTKVSYGFTTTWCKDRDNHILTKAWFIFCNVLMQPIGWYWSFHAVRVVVEKIIEAQKKK